MTPYIGLPYFLLLGLFILPLIVAGARGKADGRWIVAATFFILPLQYWRWSDFGPGVVLPELPFLLVFAIYEWVVLRVLLRQSEPKKCGWALPLALAPLVLAKVVPVAFPGWQLGFSGISYVTFRVLDMVWMITDGATGAVRFLDYAIFVFFFPTISSGPIDRFRRFQGEWRRQRSAEEFWDDLGEGIHHLFRGMLYKGIIAALIEQYLLKGARILPGWSGVPWYAVVYSADLFFDFAGYSAFAVGVSRIFGIHTPENFHLPWAAPNIKEFWNRWHISLSHWFRDHIYMRFLLQAVRRRWFKSRVVAARLGYFVSFGLMGLWHGLALHYILYGLYHATLLSGYDWYLEWKKRRAFEWPLPRVVRQVLAIGITAVFVVIGLWIFSGHWVYFPPNE